MTTTGQQLVTNSSLVTGTAMQHLMAQQGGTSETIYAQWFDVTTSYDSGLIISSEAQCLNVVIEGQPFVDAVVVSDTLTTVFCENDDVALNIERIELGVSTINDDLYIR